MINSIIQSKKIRKIVIAFIWLAIWQFIYIKIDREILIVSPFSVFIKFISLCQTELAWKNALYTLARIFVGFSFALIIGSVLAIITSYSKLLYEFLTPIINIIKATPVASFIILVLVWIKSDYVPVFVAFLMVLPIVWENISEGIYKTDKELLDMAKVFKFDLAKKIRYIYIPSVFPFLMASIKVGIGLAWKSGVAAELLSIPKYSIGARLYDSKIYLEMEDLFAWTMVVILLSVMIEVMIVKIILWLQNTKKYSI